MKYYPIALLHCIVVDNYYNKYFKTYINNWKINKHNEITRLNIYEEVYNENYWSEFHWHHSCLS